MRLHRGNKSLKRRAVCKKQHLLLLDEEGNGEMRRLYISLIFVFFLNAKIRHVCNEKKKKRPQSPKPKKLNCKGGGVCASLQNLNLTTKTEPKITC